MLRAILYITLLILSATSAISVFTCNNVTQVPQNLAFRRFGKAFEDKLAEIAQCIEKFNATVIDPIDYHLDICALLCVDIKYDDKVKVYLYEYGWSAFTITFDHLVYDDKIIGLHTSLPSQGYVFWFMAAMQKFLINQGIPVPSYQHNQPLYYIALATVETNASAALEYCRNKIGHISIDVMVDVFYLGILPYPSVEALEIFWEGFLALLVMIPIIMFLLPCGRKALSRICPSTVCNSIDNCCCKCCKVG